MMMSPSPKPEESDERSLRRCWPKVDGKVRLICGAVDDMDGFGIKPPPLGCSGTWSLDGTVALDSVDEFCTTMGLSVDGSCCDGMEDFFSVKSLE